LREKEKRGTLLWVLDKTKTAMGARMLRKFVEQPLLSRKEIQKRQEGVRELVDDPILREEIREYLNPVYDLERLLCKISYKTANPKDLIAFRNSIRMVPHIKRLLMDAKSAVLKQIYEELDELEDLYTLIFDAIEEDPPVLVHEGNIIKDGYHELVDEYRRSKTEGKSWLMEVETTEREKTGIKTLKVKYNKVFGYYIEVTNSFLSMVPDYFVRKQTLTGGERFITPRLKELEDIILGAEDKLNALEFELFRTVRDTVDGEAGRVETTANALALLDALASLAHTAEKNHYVCPKLNERGRITIKNGRHPVIELTAGQENFVPNDTLLNNEESRVLIVTGPNMAGKSTYMRQVALITLMAQIGSFVPAEEADISICDRIFTRVGASDDLASGRSTFMVEMTEVSSILRNATKKSLIILDEIGRGTSTFDGLSIAWAVVEYIADPKILGAKTVFATHYHELTELEGAVPGVQNYCISVKEQGDDIVFLRRIVKGSADKSYGVQVARLAGVPKAVLDRAKELILELVNSDIASRAREIAALAAGQDPSKKRVERQDSVDANQLSFLSVVRDDDVIDEIRQMDLTRMTPMDALNTLYRLQSEIQNRI
ncbi:MAG: DNA mismatch repair protein MutS, partial [Lachnospiraceae bacterium]|nr:DNA mismatch repair protein MutS [Lachnospiraceae bacterium]